MTPRAGDAVGAEGDVGVGIEGGVVEVPRSPSVLPNEVEVEPSAEALEVEDVASVSELLAEQPATTEASTSREQIKTLVRLPRVPHPCLTGASLPRRAMI